MFLFTFCLSAISCAGKLWIDISLDLTLETWNSTFFYGLQTRQRAQLKNLQNHSKEPIWKGGFNKGCGWIINSEIVNDFKIIFI